MQDCVGDRLGELFQSYVVEEESKPGRKWLKCLNKEVCSSFWSTCLPEGLRLKNVINRFPRITESLFPPSRYLYLGLGGCVLAVSTMGVYSLVVFVATLGFMMVVILAPTSRVHGWVFWGQMLWQTVCHLVLQHGEGLLLHQGGGVR